MCVASEQVDAGRDLQPHDLMEGKSGMAEVVSVHVLKGEVERMTEKQDDDEGNNHHDGREFGLHQQQLDSERRDDGGLGCRCHENYFRDSVKESPCHVHPHPLGPKECAKIHVDSHQ